MKLKQLINGGALAATVLTLGSAQAENYYDGIVFCKATIVQPGSVGPHSVSVTLPFTTTGQTGLQYTWWNLGSVVAGGVADSWHSEGGPGRFVAHNSGRVGAYIYLTSSAYDCYAYRWNGNGGQGEDVVQSGSIEINDEDYRKIYGDEGDMNVIPSSSVQRWRNDEQHSYYCLAFTRDVEAKMPTWHMLNRSYAADRWWVGDDGNDEEAWYVAEQSERANNGYVGAYMGYLDIGEHMPFDVKFWAPKRMRDPNDSSEDRWTDAYGNAHFTFKVEAAAFPLWEHDVSVQ